MCAGTIMMGVALVILVAAFLIQSQVLRRMFKTCDAQGEMCRSLIAKLNETTANLERANEEDK